MSLARRFVMLVLVLCLPVQSAVALASPVCDMRAPPAGSMMTMIDGHHDHAAMVATLTDHHHGANSQHPSPSKHLLGGCEHCVHCPACVLSTGASSQIVALSLHPATPQAFRSADALISVVLDTPHRPPQTI